ncbi:hypothetical protein Lal_00028571 [Lupinus albus]|nr:hypothetical protein Lal_00028571 [Lupinus albus]
MSTCHPIIVFQKEVELVTTVMLLLSGHEIFNHIFVTATAASSIWFCLPYFHLAKGTEDRMEKYKE